jgi:hypothetical protein
LPSQFPFSDVPAADPVHLKSALAQTRTQAVSEQDIIFCKQDSHERIVA